MTRWGMVGDQGVHLFLDSAGDQVDGRGAAAAIARSPGRPPCPSAQQLLGMAR